MFNYDQYIHFLNSVKDMGHDRACEILYEDYLTSKDMAGALFNPSNSIENLSEKQTNMFKATVKNKVLRVLIDTVETYGYSKFDRWVGTYLFSIASFNLDAVNDANKKLEEDYHDGKLSKGEIKRREEAIEKHQRMCSILNKVSNKIVKSEAKMIADKTGIDKSFVKYALKMNPDPCYITGDRVGFYLNSLLNELYSELDEDECDFEIDEIDWKAFFKAVYGKDNINDVATFILLEGSHRKDAFKSERVMRIWESLTEFALKTLENADPNTRQQMTEIYLKRVEKMFANGAFDLRVDLRTISEDLYPNLKKTVEKYSDRMERVFSTKTTKHA